MLCMLRRKAHCNLFPVVLLLCQRRQSIQRKVVAGNGFGIFPECAADDGAPDKDLTYFICINRLVMLLPVLHG